MAFSRYSQLAFNGEMKSFPKILISKRTTDIYVTYNSKANPNYYMEFDIPNGAVIRVPNPLSEVITEFNNKVLANRNS